MSRQSVIVTPTPGEGGDGAHFSGNVEMLQISPNQISRDGKAVALQPGVFHEQRDDRHFADIALPFAVFVHGRAFKGAYFSLDHIVTYPQGHHAETGQPLRVSPSSFPKTDMRMSIDVQLTGFALNFDLEVAVEPNTVGPDGFISFRITDMNDDVRDAMKRITRAYQAGHIPKSDDFVTKADPETPIKKAKPADVPPNVPKASRRWVNIAALTASAAGMLVVLGLSAASLYSHFFLVHSEFAAITAPQIQFLSPAQGQVSILAGNIGAPTVRDQKLYEIGSTALDGQIAESEARIATLQGQSASDRDDDLALETAHLNALKLQREELSVFAPCDCLIAWSVENLNWVNQGDRVMMLARTGPDDLRIEALVKLKDVGKLHVDEPAHFTNPETGELLSAHIERITLDEDRQVRYGFPDWLRHEETVATVLVKPDVGIDANWIGQPIKVVFSDFGETSLTERLFGSGAAQAGQ